MKNAKRTIQTWSVLAGVGAIALFAGPASASLLLHSSMDNAQAIFSPELATGVYSTMGEAIPGPSNATYEPGHVGSATRLNLAGFVIQWPIDGPIRFHGDNFDFADPDQDGGRLDFWVKFNQNPHNTSANTWLARSNWGNPENYQGDRHINYEWTGNGGNDARMMIDVFGEIPHNYRTNYEKFRVYPYEWDTYYDIAQGEWHVFTFLWRNNGGNHKDEIHMFIDGTQAGCGTCSDFNGNLPPVDAVTDFFFSPDLYGDYLLFSIDEIYSFDSWDVSGIQGNFPELDIPEGVVMKFPQHNGFPVYGSAVPKGNIEFELTVNDDQNEQCDCDLLIDGEVDRSFVATSGAHTEVAPSAPVPKGSHTWQVICDDGRITGPESSFVVEQDVPVRPGSMGRTKRAWSIQRH